MKTVTANKMARVEAPEEFKAEGVVAFQMVNFEINFFGNIFEASHDTKIMENGQQFVIGGCGFIADGYEVK
jgi:hypothetical protein